MAMQQYRYNRTVYVKQSWLEEKLLEIGDSFNIRIVKENEATVVTAVCTVAGGLLGGLLGGRLGAAAGAGLAGAVGHYGIKMMTLRELWNACKEELIELLQIILRHLRSLDTNDFLHAYIKLSGCIESRKKLAISIIDFIVLKVGGKVLSSIGS